MPSLTHAPVLQVTTSLQTFKWLVADRRYAVSGGPDGAAARGGGGGGWQVRWGGQRIRRHWRWQQVQFTGTKTALGVAGMMVAAGVLVVPQQVSCLGLW